MGNDEPKLDPKTLKGGCTVLLMLLVVPPAIYVLGAQLFTLRGLIAGPFLFLALYAMIQRVPMPPDDGSNRRTILCILRALFFGFVTWLVFITLAHLDKISGPGFWADLVTLQASVPRGAGSYTAFLMALIMAALSFPASSAAAGPIADYVEEVLSNVRFFQSGAHATAYSKAVMDAKREKMKNTSRNS